MDFFVSKDSTVKFFHPEDASVFVEVKQELTGYEERQRDELISKTEARVEQDMSKNAVDEARTEAAKLGRLHQGDREVSDSQAVEVVVSAIKAELDIWDLEHYIVGWSLPGVKPTRKNFEKLTRDMFNWMIDVVDEHRLKTVLTEDDIKNSQESSESSLKDTSSQEDSPTMESVPS